MKNILKNTLLFTITLCACLSVVEVGLRLALPQLGSRTQKTKTQIWASEEYLEFDPAVASPHCRQKILVLGDSYLQAGMVPSEKRFPKRLEAALPGTCVQIFGTGGWGTDQELLAFMQKGRSWKPDLVILNFDNTSDISNNTSNLSGKPYFRLEDNQLKLYTAKGEPIADIERFLDNKESTVRFQSYAFNLLRYGISRVKSAAKSRNLIATSDTNTPTVDLGNPDPRYTKFCGGTGRYEYCHGICCHDQLEHLSQGKLSLSYPARNTVSHLSAYIQDESPLIAYQWALTEALLKEFKNQVESNHGKFLLMTHPGPLHPGDLRLVPGSAYQVTLQTPEGGAAIDLSHPIARLNEISQRNNITFFNPNAEFLAKVRMEGLREKVWPLDDTHYGELGHEIIADQLRTFLEQFNQFSQLALP